MTPLPYETPVDEVIVKIEAALTNPNIRERISAVLKNGPRAFRVATLYEIVDPATQTHHHWCLKISSIDRTKTKGWTFKPDKSVSLGDDDSQELQALEDVLKRARSGQFAGQEGAFHLVPASDWGNIRSLLKAARSADSAVRLRVVRAVLENLAEASVPASEWLKVFTAGSDMIRRTIAISSRLAQYTKVKDELSALVAEEGVAESSLQGLLSDNPWLFGSEYSELLPRRTWTRDDRLDFMLRRTADDYLEIIEIKTPIAQPLFRHDRSHDSYAPAAPLAEAIGQVVRYIDEVERNRNSIIATDDCDPLKIRARIIIGRDGDAQQKAALRQLNSHLHRIEVLTFDQLLRIADRVLSVFQETLDKQEPAAPL